MATATQGVQNAVNRVVSDARQGDFQGLKQDVGVAAREASQVAREQFGRARELARNNPAATAGVFFGLGAIIGAFIYAAARPQPRAGDVIRRALRESAERTRDVFNAGWSSARRAM